jgi:2-methylcitrate dehydratase PrpD
MINSSTNISMQVARFASETTWNDVPESIRHQGKRALVNFFACCLAGASLPAIGMMLAVGGSTGGARILGRAATADAMTAAWVNAASANVLDFDDTLPDTIAHPTAPVAAPLLALAETRMGTPVHGKDLLLAAILGIELECRIGKAFSIRHYRRGWHITSTCGGLGAALACGRLIGLTPQQLVDAMGGAVAQASGVVETLGTMSKSLGVGGAARAGLLSALMSARGMTGPSRPLEGRFGLFNVMGEDVEPNDVVADLGIRWDLEDLAYKPYPCGVVLNAVIDACLKLRTEIADIASLTSIIVSGHPLLKERADRPGVSSGNLAQVSAQHAAAVVLRTGRAGPAEFSDAAVFDPETRALAARVSIEIDEALPMGAGRVVAVCGNRSYERTILDPLGSKGNQMTDADLAMKLSTQWTNAGIKGTPDQLIKLLWTLDTLDDAAELTRLIA